MLGHQIQVLLRTEHAERLLKTSFSLLSCTHELSVGLPAHIRKKWRGKLFYLPIFNRFRCVKRTCKYTLNLVLKWYER